MGVKRDLGIKTADMGVKRDLKPRKNLPTSFMEGPKKSHMPQNCAFIIA
jgi:hypothetical protein